MASIHASAQAFATVPERYERGRPGYPDAVVEAMRGLLGGRSPRVLDVGAGTGKLTRRLTGFARVVAVEPIHEMVRHLRSESATPAVCGTAERLPITDGWADGLTVAQAFHWFDGPSALREFHRVLRPGAPVLLVWNERLRNRHPHRAVTALLHELGERAPVYRSMTWRAAFDGGRFGPLSVRRWSWNRTVDVDTFCDRYLSVSVVASLPEDQRRQVDRRLRDIFTAAANGGTRLTEPYETWLYWARRGR